MSKEAFEVKNWSDFQVYKDRNPPWIKLHHSILDDKEFAKLSPAAKWHTVAMWILASERCGRVTDDVDEIAFRLREPAGPIASDLKKIEALGFLMRTSDGATQSDDSTMISGATQRREEKIREEKIREENITDGQEPTGSRPDDLDILMDYPCAPKGSVYHFTRAEARKLARAYGGFFDVFLELKKIERWLDTNKPKRKAVESMPSFIDKWFKKAIRDGSGEPPKSKRAQREEASRMVKAAAADRALAQRVAARGNGRDDEPTEPTGIGEIIGDNAAVQAAAARTEGPAGNPGSNQDKAAQAEIGGST